MDACPAKKGGKLPYGPGKAIFLRQRDMGRKRKNKTYKTWESKYDDYLKANFGKKTYAEMAKETGYHEKTLQNHARNLGLIRSRQLVVMAKKDAQKHKGILWKLFSGESSIC